MSMGSAPDLKYLRDKVNEYFFDPSDIKCPEAGKEREFRSALRKLRSKQRQVIDGLFDLAQEEDDKAAAEAEREALEEEEDQIGRKRKKRNESLGLTRDKEQLRTLRPAGLTLNEAVEILRVKTAEQAKEIQRSRTLTAKLEKKLKNAPRLQISLRSSRRSSLSAAAAAELPASASKKKKAGSTPARSSPAKKAGSAKKNSPARKSPSKKSPARKSPVRKSPARKSLAARKSPSRSPARSPAKKR